MVYLIDDDKSVRRAFELFLKSAGMSFVSLDSASDFLNRFECSISQDDTVVLDLNLSGMNGGELLQKLSLKGTYIPVIVVTAIDDPQTREICRQYGVKAYMRKPVDGEALIDIIKYNMAL
jgi:FixJ family two-component response regulator